MRNKGFTLIEILFSISIFALMIGGIASFWHLMIVSQTRQRVMSEVEQEGLFVMNVITQTIRNADSIISPSIGSSDSMISLDVSDAILDPVIFDSISGSVKIKEGSGSYISLTSSHVILSHLEFYNISPIGSPGAVRIEMTLERANSDNKSEYEYAKTFYATAGLR